MNKKLPLSTPLQERFDGALLAKPFYDEYIALCQKHDMYASLNPYGIDVIVSKHGQFAFSELERS